MIPIPKKMLPNQATYLKYKADNGEGSSYEKPVILNHVKIDEQKQIVYTSNGAELIGNAMLYYDLVNSAGLEEKPVNESLIIFEDRTYTIVDTDVLRGNSNKPHHYEIKLQ